MELEKANSAIKAAWIAAIISGSLTFIVSIVAGLGYSFAGVTLWNLVDAFFIFGMAYGIYKKSRVCAVIMFVYWIASKILIFSQTGNTAGLPIALLFAYYFFEGIRGTFAYHKISGLEAKPEAEPNEQINWR